MVGWRQMFPLSTYHLNIIDMIHRDYKSDLSETEWKFWSQNYTWFIERQYPFEVAVEEADKSLEKFLMENKMKDDSKDINFQNLVDELVEMSAEISNKYYKIK